MAGNFALSFHSPIIDTPVPVTAGTGINGLRRIYKEVPILEFITFYQNALHLKWLKTVSKTQTLMGHYYHSLSVDATIMVSKNCPIIGEYVGIILVTL